MPAVDEARVGRFEREARSVSALNHPNIITIYETGDARGMRFIATEFIDGVTVRTLLGRRRLDVRHALDIALQVAAALAAAHAAGVVHRDLKPENVMVRADGYVKVLDFGLAKLTGAELLAHASEAATHAFETEAGLVMGTVRYMAPEQARGEEIDSRADVFALGVLLYEMLAGTPPFTGPSAADIISALVSQEPAATRGRAGRARSHRPHGAAEEEVRTLSELHPDAGGAPRGASHARRTARDSRPRRAQCRSTRRTPRQDWCVPTPASSGSADSGPSGAGRRRRARRVIDSLAVLPLVNHSPDREIDYLCDGLTESLINSLSQLPRLRVMARSTVFRYSSLDRGRPDRGPRASGSSRAHGPRQTARRRSSPSAPSWSTSTTGRSCGARCSTGLPADVATLQAEITHELTDALRLRLTRDQKRRLSKRHTVSATAYQLYLRGRYLSNTRTGHALQEAQQLFERAVREDPAYALAYAGLADCRSLLAVSLRPATVAITIRQAREAAHKALELDESLAEGHASLAFIKFRFDWDWSRAEAEFARAIDLNPGHAPTRQWHAMFLASRSRFDAALAEMRVALDLDPLSLVIQTGIGRILHFARRFEEAMAQYEHVLQTNPAFGQTYIDLGAHAAGDQRFSARARGPGPRRRAHRRACRPCSC